MDIKVTLRLTDRGREATSLGWEKVEVIEFGFDQGGSLEQVVCIAEGESQHGPVERGLLKQGEATGTFEIFTIGGHDLHEDLFFNYEVDVVGVRRGDQQTLKG